MNSGTSPLFKTCLLIKTHWCLTRSQITTKQHITHYDALGLTSKATQADIKSAYYKLSMIYHPDKNLDKSEETVKKFRDITNAYEVLGNVHSRKQYDRGTFFAGDSKRNSDDSQNKFYKSREFRSRPPAPKGYTTVYDFDEWTRAHYTLNFAKTQRSKQYQFYADERKRHLVNNIEKERTIVGIIIVSFILGLLFTKQTDNDIVKNNKK